MNKFLNNLMVIIRNRNKLIRRTCDNPFDFLTARQNINLMQLIYSNFFYEWLFLYEWLFYMLSEISFNTVFLCTIASYIIMTYWEVILNMFYKRSMFLINVFINVFNQFFY